MDTYTFIGRYKREAIYFNQVKNELMIEKDHSYLTGVKEEDDKKIRMLFSFLPGKAKERDEKVIISFIGEKITACEWHGDEEGSWSTSCDNILCIIEGTPKENEMEFCCYCGKKLVQVVFEEEG